MTDKKKQIAPDGVTEAGAVELEENELDEVTGGFSASGTGNFKVEIEGIKQSLTEKAGIRVGGRANKLGVRAIKGVKAGDGSV